MNKKNKRKNAPKSPGRYLSPKEAKMMRQWEELKNKYKEDDKK